MNIYKRIYVINIMILFIIIIFIPITGIADCPLIIDNISGGRGVFAEIVNHGDVDAINVSWSIYIDGNFIFKPSEGFVNNSIPCIAQGATQFAWAPVFGFGRALIRISVWLPKEDPIVRQCSGFILGPFVLIW